MRLEAGLTPAALAEEVGMPRETVADLEAGQVAPPSDLIEHIAVALGRRLRDFALSETGIQDNTSRHWVS